eukprot:TRINITY_DN5178_c0_g3_i1.p1 TRINITY_DN5178_c0_g3~~TRINITY_DN5178_c0_g3_i1.p1  ORF type:complete len:347 (-),score=97.88 TRINITY_DN5178_c0_g3_i1:331-1371(-)
MVGCAMIWCCNKESTDKTQELLGERTEAVPGLVASEVEEQQTSHATSLADHAAAQSNQSPQQAAQNVENASKPAGYSEAKPPLPAAAPEAAPASPAAAPAAAPATAAPAAVPAAAPAVAPAEASAAAETPPVHDVWLTQMNQLFRQIRREPKPPGSIQCASYFRAMEAMPGIYDALFSVQLVRSQLKGDIENNLGEIKERLADANMDAESTTLREIMLHDLQKVGLDNVRLHRQRSAIWGQLWVNRASKFIFTFLRQILEGKSGKQAAEAAYDTLRPFHGWMTRNFVGMAMTAAAISREGLIEKLDLPDEATAMKEMSNFLTLGEPIVADILELMEELGTNFPDRM